MRTTSRVPALCGIAALLAALIAGAASAQSQVVYFGLPFPENVAGFARGSTHDFEKTHPGLGYSVKYTRRPWFADIYIYDMRLRTIPEDPRSDAVRSQFERAEGDIFAQQKSGRYQNVALRGRYSIADGNKRDRVTCGNFTLTRGTAKLDSYLCVAGWRNKFVKFRISAPTASGNDARARQFVEAWARTLWP
jgi:hypothetical protein